MTWLDDLKGCDSLKAFLQHTTVGVLISTPEGGILWANAAFSTWTGYSLPELQKYGWKQITVPGQELDTDTAKATDWDAFIPVYSVQKQYYRKNQTAGWGVMTAMRFPPYGPIEFCIVTWIPQESAADVALSAAMAAIDKSEAAYRVLVATMAELTTISEEQRFIMSAAHLAQKYPKTTWTVIALGFGLFGLNNSLEILKTLHVVPPNVTIAVPEVK